MNILSKLKDINSKLRDKMKDTNTEFADQSDKQQFITALIKALKDDSFAIYRLYNIIHKENEVRSNTDSNTSTTLEDQHTALNKEYNALFLFRSFSILYGIFQKNM